MKYYLIAGEASGDLHGANLMRALAEIDPQAQFRFWGGDRMEAVGGKLIKHYRDLAFMGFWEVVTNLRTILRNIDLCKADITAYQPDALIFIDYPGFNMRIAKWAKRQGIPTHYYISPQIWAWKENRIKAIRRDVDAMYVILPFEKDFYEGKHQYPVHFVGHPLLDAIAARREVSMEVFKRENGLDERPIIALLPGSRKQEIAKMLSVMLSVVGSYHPYQFVIAGAPSLGYDFYRQFIREENVHFVSGKTYDLLSHAHAALVTSGTATLETALFRVPEVVCYRGNWISYQIAKRVISLKYISLVNLIMDAPVVTELIQGDLNTRNLKVELDKLLDPAYRDKLQRDYQALRERLGNEGASRRTAQAIYNSLQDKRHNDRS
ncbi:lipid-A-disaccharide synthase [Capnocytophaga granulosa]|uniref:Lipid-A-disaccharide synthase n=1 Tax=Capnocytophaga granulosa TaxID=45242 RepID=A0A1H2Y015_9FLAO|nr:lipid-A-disaccharide synthase [Capnocytophaga granulosa]EPD31816.1 lipid-A-disaccharide synthase [Capnocytophaga granulosa ATCC 51502]SDW98315.1 lipid-A-disaccharide synthase [Capnocytophaga granulosa]SUX23547.1 Lipid-A-disaccharide synthase [Capnocytophaga granulosa]